MKIPRAIQALTTQFERLPSIGPKTAQRLTFYLLHVPQPMLDEFADAIASLKKNTVQCLTCQNIAETDPCPICDDPNRDGRVVMVVEHPLDVMVVERTGVFNGVYHVLHGVIAPLENIGPDDLYLKELLARLENGKITEIILGLNPTMEGEATALYLKNKISRLTINDPSANSGQVLRITRLGQGMPTGGDMQYTDESTLRQALAGRREY